MSKRQLRWGLLGCGLITGDFAEALKLLPPDEHKVVALGSRSLERCKEFQKKHDLKNAKAYGSYEEFFSDPEVEIAYIGTRNNQHVENVLQGIKAKKHILCEKPLGMNKDEVMKMIKSAKQNGVYLQEVIKIINLKEPVLNGPSRRNGTGCIEMIRRSPGNYETCVSVSSCSRKFEPASVPYPTGKLVWVDLTADNPHREAFWSRFSPVYHEIQKVLKQGLLGDVQILQANLGFPIIENLERLNQLDFGGGMALDLGGYLCQLAVFVFGKAAPIEKICCAGWKHGGVDDTACITIIYSGKRMAQLMYSGSTAMAGSAQICGTKGRIEIPAEMNFPEQCKVIIIPADPFAEPTVTNIEKPRPAADSSKFFFKATTGLAYEAEGVRKHIIQGDLESNEMPFDETIKVAEMLDEIRKQLGMPK